jgi:cell division septal protein FtsQ
MSSGLVDLRKKKVGGHMPKWTIRFPHREKPRSPLRARRRRARLMIGVGVAVVLCGAVFGLSAATYHPRLTITDIDVRGAEGTKPDDIRAVVEGTVSTSTPQFFSSANIFLYPQEEIERMIANAFPRIKHVSVGRESLLSQAVVVTIQERQPFARWCAMSEGACYALDSSGFIFAPSLEKNGFRTSYTFKGGILGDPIGKKYMSGNFSGVVSLLDKLGEEGYPAYTITAENEHDFSIRLTDGVLLRASYGVELEEFVRNLELVLASDALQGKRRTIEYIDLRFGNRVYYKMKGSAGETRAQ